MKLKAALLFVCAASPALAQDAAVDGEKMKICQGQMVSYLNSAIDSGARVQVLTTENAALKKQLAECKPVDPSPPSPPPVHMGPGHQPSTGPGSPPK